MLSRQTLVESVYSLYESSSFIVSLKDENLNFLYGNKMMRDVIVGDQSLKIILGKSDYDFHCEEYADLYKLLAIAPLFLMNHKIN